MRRLLLVTIFLRTLKLWTNLYIVCARRGGFESSHVLRAIYAVGLDDPLHIVGAWQLQTHSLWRNGGSRHSSIRIFQNAMARLFSWQGIRLLFLATGGSEGTGYWTGTGLCQHNACLAMAMDVSGSRAVCHQQFRHSPLGMSSAVGQHCMTIWLRERCALGVWCSLHLLTTGRARRRR